MLKIVSICAALLLAAAAFSTSAEAQRVGFKGGGVRMGGAHFGGARVGHIGGRGMYRAGVSSGRYGRSAYRHGYGYRHGYNDNYWPYVALGVGAVAAASALPYYAGAYADPYYAYGYPYSGGSYGYNQQILQSNGMNSPVYFPY
jgi:hypothetical protein